MGCHGDPRSDSWPQTMQAIRGITGWVLIYSHNLKLFNDLSVSQVFGAIWLLVTAILVCRRCDGVDFLTRLTTAVAGCILLKESYSMKYIVAGVCSLLGVSSFPGPRFYLAPILSSLSDTTCQKERQCKGWQLLVCSETPERIHRFVQLGGAHPMHVMTFFSLWCTIVASLGVGVFNIPIVYPTPWAWLLLLVVGASGFVTQISTLVNLHLPSEHPLLFQTILTMGLQRETVSRRVTGLYAKVFFAVVLDRLFFGVVPSLLSVLGASIIMSTALYVILTKRESPPDSNTDSATA